MLLLQKTLILLSIVVCSLNLNAQYLPDLKIPQLKPSFYESLQAKTAIQTSSDFQMKGSVKTVLETISTDQIDLAKNLFLTVSYSFSEKGNLLSYSEDSTSSLFTGYDEKRSIINSYDSTGKILSQSIISRGPQAYRSKSTIRFNKQGFMEHEAYICFSCSLDYHNKPKNDSIFDYTLDYIWSKNSDSVQLKYHYLKAQSPYQRKQDRLYSFVREINDKKKRKDKLNLNEDPSGSYGFVDEYIYDTQGRITQWTIWDDEVKSSVSSHQMIEYTYNEKGELTEIKHSSTGSSPDYNSFVLNFQVEINYTSYDKYGNWVEREVKVTSSNYGMHDIRCNSSYCYKREFSYY